MPRNRPIPRNRVKRRRKPVRGTTRIVRPAKCGYLYGYEIVPRPVVIPDRDKIKPKPFYYYPGASFGPETYMPDGPFMSGISSETHMFRTTITSCAHCKDIFIFTHI